MNWAIERDTNKTPMRLWWLRPTTNPAPVLLVMAVCPRCGSKRLVQNACFDCWWKP